MEQTEIETKPSEPTLPKTPNISNLSMRKQVVLWLLDYDIKYDPSNIYMMMKTCGILPSFFINKYIKRLGILKKSESEIYDEILKLGFMVNIDKEKMLKHITTHIDNSFELLDVSKLPSDFISVCDELMTINEQLVHQKIPLPDPFKGRPLIEWKTCAYAGCFQTFSSEDKLIEHLKSKKCYTPRFHKHHEELIEAFELTPEKVISKGMTCCPSIICSEYEFKTPTNLIHHFRCLGIKPFWQVGTVITSVDDTNTSTTINLELPNIFTASECVICISEKPSIIIFPCTHKIYCSPCYITSKMERCAICFSKITDAIPFA